MSYLRKIKSIFKLAKPHKLYFFLEWLFHLLHISCKIVEPIFTANVITCLTVGNYKGAYLYLILDIVQVVVRNIFAHLNYHYYRLNYNHQYMHMQNLMINKLSKASTSNFEHTPKEMLSTIVVSNLYKVGNFSDILVTKFCKLIQIIITMVIVLCTNVWIGLTIIALSIVNYFILITINKRRAEAQKRILDNKDRLSNQLTNIIDNKELIRERDNFRTLKQKYLKECRDYCENEGQDTMIASFRSNIFFVFYKLIIFLITCLLIYLVSDGILTLTLYLIVTPYLLTCTESLNDIIDFSFNIEDTDVSVKRINTVLNFTEDQLIKFGNIKTDNNTQNLSLIDVKYRNSEVNSPYYGNLNGLDITFKHNAINVVKGGKNCGKRVIYYLLCRKIKPDDGVILLDHINIYDYEQKDYRNHIFYTHANPIFLEGSILKNLKFASNDREHIEFVCKQLGIYEFIMGLPKQFSTNINDAHIPSNILYLIGFARTLLKDSDITIIYELPTSLTDEQRNNLKKCLVKYSEKHTIIYFTALNDMDDIANVTFEMEYSKVKNIKTKNTLV